MTDEINDVPVFQSTSGRGRAYGPSRSERLLLTQTPGSMLFDSPIYYVFLAAVVPLYWCLRRSGQNALLLSASYFFYGWWDWRFLSLVFISTVFDFSGAQALGR